MGNALELPGCISTVQALGGAKRSRVHGAMPMLLQLTSPHSNDRAEHRRLYQAGASVAGNGEAHPVAMACSGARWLLGYAVDTWD